MTKTQSVGAVNSVTAYDIRLRGVLRGEEEAEIERYVLSISIPDLSLVRIPCSVIGYIFLPKEGGK